MSDRSSGAGRRRPRSPASRRSGAELDAERGEFLGEAGEDVGSDLAGGRAVGVVGLENRAERDAGDPLGQVESGPSVANADRPALEFVAGQQARSTPAWMVAASFQARLAASSMPVFMPKPPVGVNRWTASPHRRTRPRPYCSATSARPAIHSWVSRISTSSAWPRSRSPGAARRRRRGVTFDCVVEELVVGVEVDQVGHGGRSQHPVLPGRPADDVPVQRGYAGTWSG